MKAYKFTVTVEFADDAEVSTEELRELIDGAVLEYIPDIGDPPPIVHVTHLNDPGE